MAERVVAHEVTDDKVVFFTVEGCLEVAEGRVVSRFNALDAEDVTVFDVSELPGGHLEPVILLARE